MVTQTLGRYFLAILLGIAGISKVLDPSSLYQTLETSNLYPASTLLLLTYSIPLWEIFTAFYLTSYDGKAQNAGILSSTLLCMGFVSFLTIGIINQTITDCGCFGKLELSYVSPEVALIRAATMLALCLLLIVKTTKHQTNQ